MSYNDRFDYLPYSSSNYIVAGINLKNIDQENIEKLHQLYLNLLTNNKFVQKCYLYSPFWDQFKDKVNECGSLEDKHMKYYYALCNYGELKQCCPVPFLRFNSIVDMSRAAWIEIFLDERWSELEL